MSMNEMKNVVFPAASIDDWKQKAEETLKGKSVDSISKGTYEDIKLKPLYTKEDLDNQNVSQFPGYEDYRRGVNSLGYVTNEWKVAQTFPAANPNELKSLLDASFEKGQTAISFEVSEQVLAEMSAILADIYSSYSFSVNAKAYHAELLTTVRDLAAVRGGNQEVSGYIGLDPVALMVEGSQAQKLSDIYDQLAETISQTNEELPNLKTILVDTTPYHNGGANAVQELAIALSTGVQHLQELTERSLSLETILDKLVFKFSIGANFFMEVAKLRAAKLLWSKLTESYGAVSNLQKMVISAETSKFTKTKYDPYVNMLRSGNEAFAAILGGIQYLHVSPFNEPEGNVTVFSDRIARNTQLVLKEEAHLKKVIDPAGGSWYIESLTNELAEKAWALFLEIDAKEGIVSSLRSNWLQDQIAAVKEKRQKDIFTRKQSMIGTNIYANLQDEPIEVAETNSVVEAGVEAIQPIPQERLALPYETLRGKAEKLTQASVEPSIGLISLGALKYHKARADFITGFAAPGGVKTVKSEEINSFDEAKGFIENTQLSHYCICGTNDQYNEIGLELLKEIKNQYPALKVYLAGAPENQADWIEAGVAEIITVKSNCYGTLTKLLDEMEVESK
jgi:methylmalonyl-CoA mutase